MFKLKISIHKKMNGFSLIEILVVISIIGFLATMAAYALNIARMKARNASRLSDINQVQKAIDLYYDNNGHYPQVSYASTNDENCGEDGKWCDLETELESYISRLPRDPSGLQNNFRYYYDSNSEDDYQSYGLMTSLEGSNNEELAENDGGFYPEFYEKGSQPKYCKDNFNTEWYADYSYVCAPGS
jgi:general secretion pathway protein G